MDPATGVYYMFYTCYHKGLYEDGSVRNPLPFDPGVE